MGDIGACWDNAVVERFFGSLKYNWLFKIAQPTREHMEMDVAKYIRYYKMERLHTANSDLSPVAYEMVNQESGEVSCQFCSSRAGSAAQI